MENEIKETVLSEELKDKILKSILFHLATYGVFDRLTLSELKRKESYLLSPRQIEYLNMHQSYLAYMRDNDIFSELVDPSTFTRDDPNAKIALRPLTFGVGSLIRYKKFVTRKTEKRTKVTPQKVFLFFKKEIREEYTVEVNDIYYVPMMSEDVISFCKKISETLIGCGYKDAKVSFKTVDVLLAGYKYYWTFNDLITWSAIKNNKIEKKCRFAAKELRKVGEDIYEPIDNGLPRTESGRSISMQIDASMSRGSDQLEFERKIRNAARKYYEANYGKIDFLN